MTELFAVLTSIALLDSLSILPVCLVPLIFLLTSPRPFIYTLTFLMGLLVVYIPFGLLLGFGLDTAFNTIGQVIGDWLKKDPAAIELVFQFIIGIGLLLLGYQIAKKHTQKLQQEPELKITARFAFTFSALLMLTGLWGALPYFAAVDQILRAELNTTWMLFSILYYNFIFILPLIILFIIGIFLGPKAKSLLERIAAWLLHFGKIAITLALYLLGITLMIDAVGWYLGMPLIKFN